MLPAILGLGVVRCRGTASWVGHRDGRLSRAAPARCGVVMRALLCLRWQPVERDDDVEDGGRQAIENLGQLLRLLDGDADPPPTASSAQAIRDTAPTSFPDGMCSLT